MSAKKIGKSTGSPPQAAAGSRSSLVDALGEAAWREADRALADALSYMDELSQARGERRAELLALANQALTLAARRRGLVRTGELGGVVPYDPEHHEWRGRKGGADAVEIFVRGVSRGGEMLAKPRVRRPK